MDCPESGRRGLSIQIMLGRCFPHRYDGLPEQIIQVDLIAQGWDTSPPHTFVVITADRDLAYAVSTLRMRGYRVVVISPSDTHDIFAQASVKIELTRALLGLKQDVGVDAFLNESVPTSTFTRQQHTARPTSSITQYQTPRSPVGTNRHEKPSAGFELRDLPNARARRDSVFSYTRKFDVFGGMEDIPATSDLGPFGLGGGPLFPRSQSRAEMQSRSRADSAPPNMFSTGALPPYAENGNRSPDRPASKGKQREIPLDEPEDIAPYPGPFSHIYSGSAFDPFGGERSFKSRAMGSSSNSSTSSTSKDSLFSLVPAPEPNVETSTAPTSADNFPFTHQPPQKAEIVIEVVNEPTRKSPPPPPVGPAQTNMAAPQMVPPSSSSVIETAKKATLASTGPDVKIPATAQKISTPTTLVPPAPTNKVVQPPTVAAKEAAKPAMSSNAPPIVSSFKKAAPAMSSNTPPIAGPSKQAIPTSNPSARPSVPPAFQLLVDVLRKNGAMKHSTLGDALHTKGYSGYKSLKALVSAAFELDIVEPRPKEGKQEVWALTKRYA